MPKIKVGIMYDFDKTLCTTDMQNYAFMDDIGMKPEEFQLKGNVFLPHE